MKEKLFTDEQKEKFIAMDKAFFKGMHHRMKHGMYSILLQVTGTTAGLALQIAGIIPWWLQFINLGAWAIIARAYYTRHSKQADKIFYTARDAFRETIKDNEKVNDLFPPDHKQEATQ